MAEQRIVGRGGVTTVISDSYAPSFTVGPAEPPERDFAAEQKADRAKRSELRKRFPAMSDAQFDDLLMRADFPKAITRTIPAWGSGASEPIFSLKQVDAYVQRERELAALLPKSVK